MSDRSIRADEKPIACILRTCDEIDALHPPATLTGSAVRHATRDIRHAAQELEHVVELLVAELEDAERAAEW